jgi:aspartate aminotransferase
MRPFAERLSVVAPSITLAMNARAADLKAKGVDVFSFGVGEPDFDPPRFVLDAAKAAIDAGCSKYTAVSGIAPLKEAIAAFCKERRGFEVTPANIIVGVGAKHVLFNLALALYEAGDEVIIPAPYWVSYPEQVRMVGATPVVVVTTEESGFRLSPAQLEAALTPKTKAVVLCTPSNPTGSAYSRAELEGLAAVLRKHDCYIIVDEIYAELVYDGFEHVSLAALAPDMKDRIIVVDGVSKTWAMTGWRIGWAVAHPKLIKAIDTIQGQSTTNPTAVAQHAAKAALTGPIGVVTEMRDAFQKRRNVMVDGLNALPGVTCRMPEGAFYAFADMRGLYGIKGPKGVLANDEDVAGWLLDVAHVSGVPGSGFGAPGYLRLSYASSEERIRGALSSIATCIAQAERV